MPINDQNAIIETTRDRPKPTGFDILVKVKAVSVNPVDTKIRAAKTADGTLTVAGWDAAGIVTAIGEKVTHFKEGDAVWYAGDITRPGSNADFQLVDERLAAKKPKTLNFVAAAAMPLTLLTAWEALYERLGIPRNPASNKGKRLLIINGAGGVGSIAIQLAKLAGVGVLASASRKESQDWCYRLGADEVIQHREISKLPDQAADYILCCHDTDAYFDQAARIVKPFGIICLLASSKRPHNIQALMQKSAGLVWEFMFTRSSFQTPDMIRQQVILAESAQMVDKKMLKTTLTKTLTPLTADTLRKAHALVEAGGMIGKVAIAL